MHKTINIIQYIAIDLSLYTKAHCPKLTIDGNYHGNLDFDWLLSPVTMVVAIDGKVNVP